MDGDYDDIVKHLLGSGADIEEDDRRHPRLRKKQINKETTQEKDIVVYEEE
jgi:hypothetical protein